MSGSVAHDAADLVISGLKPLLEQIAGRMPDIGELKAINLAVGKCLEQGAENAEEIAQLRETMKNFADNFVTLTEEVRSYHNNTIDQYDRLGKRVHDLEEWRRRIERDGTSLTETGGQ